VIGIIIDIALVVIIITCAFRGFRNGMVRGLCGFLAIVLALIIGNAAADTFSGEFTDALRPFVGGIVDGKLQKMLSPNKDEIYVSGEADETDEADDTKTNKTKENAGKDMVDYGYDTTTTYGSVMQTLRNLGFLESISDKIATAIDETSTETGYALGDVISTKLSSTLAHIAIFAIAFLLLSIVFAVVGNLLNVVFSLPGLRLLDQIAGTALGLLKGVVIVMFLALVFRYVGIIKADMLEETRVLMYFAEHNTIANLLGI